MSYVYAFLSWIMNGCYAVVENYGIDIVIFTLITKIIMLPLSIWTHFNSITMIKIQPELNMIKAKYYGQKDIIADEEAKLYKEQGYHPMLTMIPTILQFVLLIGVVGVIRLGIENPAIDMTWGPINLGAVPSEEGLKLIWSPIVAGLSAWVMCWTQNISNVLQSEQSKANKYGMMIFSIVLSLYLGWFVPVGTAWYWVCSNLMSVAQMYILNWCIKPSKYVDYEALEASRQALSKLENVGKTKAKKDKAYYANKKREKQDYKRFFSVVNKHLVFYSEGKGFYKYFKGVIEYILQKTNITIHYITSDPNDTVFELSKMNDRFRTYYIGENKLITLMMKMDADVVVMTMPDLQKYHIKRSIVRDDVEYIYMDHGINSLNLVLRPHALDYFDTVFCGNDLCYEEQRAQEQVYDIKPRNLVKYGYCLIDEMTDEYNKKDHKTSDVKTILIGPSWNPDNIGDVCIETILDQLLGRGYNVIYRPHPQYVRHYKEKLESLREKYASHKDFELQMDFSSNDVVMDADILMTDWSGIAYEYSFVTLKPTLFIDTPMKVMNPDYEKLGIVPFDIEIRNKIGVSLKPDELDRLPEVVDKLLNDEMYSKESMSEIKKKYLYNVGCSAEVGAKYIIGAIQRKIKEKKAI